MNKVKLKVKNINQWKNFKKALVKSLFGNFIKHLVAQDGLTSKIKDVENRIHQTSLTKIIHSLYTSNINIKCQVLSQKTSISYMSHKC